jgi:5-formyltetrahydrofolate cyclo-ligase
MKKKAEIRQKMKIALKNFDSVQKQQETAAIMAQFFASENYQKAKIIAAYLPLDFEFDMTRMLQDKTKRIVIPKVLSGHRMIFTDYDVDNLVATSLGIKTSKSDQSVQPDLIIVPGLAWSSDGYRVGFGGGYYDRYLADFEGETVSFVYTCQLIPTVTPDVFDVPVSKIFTVYQ